MQTTISTSISVSCTSPSSLSSTGISLISVISVPARPPVILTVSSSSVFPSVTSVILPLFSAFSTFLLALFPGFFGQEAALDVKGSVVADVLLLLSSGSLGESDFEDSEDAFLVDGHQSLFLGLPDVNNLLLSDVDDHVEAFDLPADDLCDPEGLVHQLLGCLDCHEGLALSEEEGE